MKLKFLWDEEEEKEEKKEVKLGSQFGGGFGLSELIKKQKEKPKFDITSTKLKFTELIEPAEPVVSTQFGIGAKAVGSATLTKPVEIPSYWGISDLTEQKPVSPEVQQMETLSFKMKELPTRKEQESFCYELLTGKKVDDIFTLPLEERKKALTLMTQLQRTAVTTTEKFNKVIGQVGWIGAIGMMGYSILPLIEKLPANILNKIVYKVEGKTVKGKELFEAIRRVNYPDPRAGFGKPSIIDKKIFTKFTEEGGFKSLAERMKGITITEVTPRFAFGTKLYAGLPTDEIVKSLVKTGKVTVDIARELSLAKPELVSQVIQNLSIASPAIASKLAPELVKLIPQEEALKKVEPEVKEEIPKAEVKEPTKIEIPEKQIIPTTIEKAKEILKVDPKEPLVSKDMLAKKMVEKKVSLADIEAVKGEKIDVKKPKDIIVALRDINAVEKEVIKEPPPKVTPKGIRPLEVAEEKYPERFAKEEIKEFKKFITEEEKEFLKAEEEYPAKIVKEEIEELKPLATPAQIKEAHILAKEHKLIVKTPSGKMSNLRYKRLAKNFTGKTSIKDMTKEEASEFIEAIKSVVQRKPWEPPIIPLSTKIVPKEFFEMEFKEPGISKIITPKKYYLRILGAEPLLKDLTDSMELLSLKRTEINKWVGDIIKKINKEATITHKFKAMIYNRPTDQVATMRDLLDKHENPPDFLKPKEKEIFKEVRDFTKDMLVKTNEVRDRVGLDPIEDIKTYIPHFLDELAKQIVNKRYPFPEDVKYWLGRNMPKKIYNPTAMERRVKDDLKDFFSKDLGALLKTLAKYDLRDIYLSEPYSVLRAELNALGDKIPARLRTEIDLFLKHDIFNYPTELDLMLNKTLEKPTDVINFFLKPFNRIISNPVSSLSNVYRQGLMGGAIAGKPRLVLRNLLTQKLLNINIYPIKNYLKAQFWKTPEGVIEEIRDTTFYKLSIRKFEDLPPLLRPVQWGMYPYSKSHAGINYISNVDVSGKVGYYYGKDMIRWCETSKGKAYIEKYAKKHNLTGKAENDLTWREGDEIEEAIEAMSVTQWLYFSTDMPRVFRGKGARAFWSLQSWYMNWFGKHLREGLIRMGGKTSRGRIVRPGDRVNLIKGLIVILALTEGIKRETGIDMRRFLFFPFPTYIFPPAMQLILNTYKLITADSDSKRKSAINNLKNNLKLLIPFSGATKRWWQYIKGEITLKEWLFYMERRKAKISREPLKIIIPESGKLKFTEPKLDIKSTKLKFTF